MYEYGAFGGVDAAGKIIQCHLHDMFPDFSRVFRIVGECLGIGYHDKKIRKFTGVLEVNTFLQGA